MELVPRLKDEHAWIRREMDVIEAFLREEDFARVDELRERLKALWIFLLRHERMEEGWMAGGGEGSFRRLSDAERERARREHGAIMSVLDSLGALLGKFDGQSRGGPMPLEERLSARSAVEGLFRFVREHLEREDKDILSPARPATAAAFS